MNKEGGGHMVGEVVGGVMVELGESEEVEYFIIQQILH